mmetsp:Transcript_26207/g.41557  ORF Transcript_26207/g.41557 Transcript_26207/m.41557 type:complete len:434 (+) Transcript_26207:46-1347(+)|eukprot:CAMPEP_0197054738 /NCGR_PEP_ID=MMETSP1384-20130603/48729_1 /TAXON_ID=29189 /ORGANISM="Ammonia sp." /LENGTH=433 /DNA_ID=CAMNT_0042488035 /DNA_START=40 /DNA_END=1341 /DNA_ORIENTATION=+
MLGSDLDCIDAMDPDLLSQLPMQSDIEDLRDNVSISMLSSSNLDLDATEQDELVIHDNAHNAKHRHSKRKKNKALYGDEADEMNDARQQHQRKQLDLVNDRDDTDDTDLDDIVKPTDNELDMVDERAWYWRPKNWLKLNLVFFLLALLISGISQPKMLFNLLQILLSWMETHIVTGSFVFISLYITCDLLMLPCLIFTLGAGFVYCNVLHSMVRGLLLSTFIVFVSELIGSTMAFLTARYLLRKTIKKIAEKYPKFSLIDAAVKRHGFKVTLLFRMSPVTPYNLLNYFMGLTSVRFMDYSMASIGILPNFFVCCLVGGSIHHIYQLSQIDITSNIPLLVVSCVGFAFVIFLIVYGTRFIKRELAKLSLQMKAEQDILSSSDNEEIHPLTEHDVNACDIDLEHALDPKDAASSNLDDIVSIDLVSNNDVSNIDI